MTETPREGPLTRSVLPHEDRYRNIYLSKSDYRLVSYFASKDNIPRTAALHELIVAGIVCRTEHHKLLLEKYERGERKSECLA